MIDLFWKEPEIERERTRNQEPNKRVREEEQYREGKERVKLTQRKESKDTERE